MYTLQELAQLDWRKLVHLSDQELGQIDLAAVNLACAVGLPDAENLDRETCLRTLDGWTQLVVLETQRHEYLYYRIPEQYGNSWGQFCMLVMVTLLQRDMGVRYDPRLKDNLWVERDASSLFLHGVLATRFGTCASLPVLYVAIGRRLGYPLKLVNVPDHLFARWESSDGERFNIEATSIGLSNPPDTHYMLGSGAMPSTTRERCGFLKSHSPRGELAGFLKGRGWCWFHHRCWSEAADSFAWAYCMLPGPVPEKCLVEALLPWQAELFRLPSPVRSLTVHLPEDVTTAYPGLPRGIKVEFLRLQATDNLLKLEPFCKAVQTLPPQSVIVKVDYVPLPFGGGKIGFTIVSCIGESTMYDYLQGRFLSPDPLRTGTNLFDYCENDPINKTDPSGLETAESLPPAERDMRLAELKGVRPKIEQAIQTLESRLSNRQSRLGDLQNEASQGPPLMPPKSILGRQQTQSPAEQEAQLQEHLARSRSARARLASQGSGLEAEIGDLTSRLVALQALLSDVDRTINYLERPYYQEITQNRASHVDHPQAMQFSQATTVLRTKNPKGFGFDDQDEVLYLAGHQMPAGVTLGSLNKQLREAATTQGTTIGYGTGGNWSIAFLAGNTAQVKGPVTEAGRYIADIARRQREEAVKLVRTIMEVVHLILDVIGVVDPTGLADWANAGIYLAEGRPIEASVSAASAIVVGDAFKIGKYAIRPAKAPRMAEGMAAASGGMGFERHVNAFIHEWNAESVLEPYIQRRMRELGVGPKKVGIIDDVESGTAFSMEHALGGRNTRPAWSGASKGGINVDYAVFNPDHLPIPSWQRASLRDRIDAVIIHELTEYNSRAATTALRHKSAILHSPDTAAKITPGARKILEDYRTYFLQHMQQGR